MYVYMAVRQSARTLCHLVRGPVAPHKVRVHKVGVHKVGGTRLGKNVRGWVVCVRKIDDIFEESDAPIIVFHGNGWGEGGGRGHKGWE